MSCTTCPTTNCTCCHVHNVIIDNNLSVGNTTTLNTCCNTGGALTINSTNTAQISGDLVVINGTTGQSALSVSAGDVSVAENISCQQLTETSDSRLKTNVVAIEDALSIVQKMNGVRFNWLAAEENEAATANPALPDNVGNNARPMHIGLIAQEVQSVLPEVVCENKEGQLSVAYTNIVAVLVEAVKELTVKVEQLQSE